MLQRVFAGGAVMALGFSVQAFGAELAGAVSSERAPRERVYYDGVDEHGNLVGGVVEMPMVEAAVRRMQDAGRVGRGAAADNRVDIVIVGDGYTAGEMATFHSDAAFTRDAFLSYEPFKSYELYFNFHEVEVVSSESGVDNDPTQGILKNTALDMRFWCSGTERLLCVNVTKAYSFAGMAPAVDQVLAIANSSKYGGAGYTGSDLATSAGHNSLAPEIAVHELGHSLGNLADEYDYGGPATYTGGETGAPDSSIYEAVTMAALNTKWTNWLGYTGDVRFDNPVNTYEGAEYSQFGVYRPSPNSMMRSLNRKFNAPSAESLIVEVYKQVSPIDGHSSNAAPVGSDESVSVTPMTPLDHDLDIEWTLDGAPIAAASGQTTLDLSTLGITSSSVVRATVTDNTDMVRDESLRAAWMTDSVEWAVTAVGCGAADLDGDGGLDLDDINLFAQAFVAQETAADLDGSGTFNLDDINLFADAFVAGCP